MPSRSRWEQLATELHGDTARTHQENHCDKYGHTWPPIGACNPGDSHWCHGCGDHRIIAADGTVTIYREDGVDKEEKRLRDAVKRANDAVKGATPGTTAMKRAVERVNRANRALLAWQEAHS